MHPTARSFAATRRSRSPESRYPDPTRRGEPAPTGVHPLARAGDVEQPFHCPRGGSADPSPKVLEKQVEQSVPAAGRLVGPPRLARQLEAPLVVGQRAASKVLLSNYRCLASTRVPGWWRCPIQRSSPARRSGRRRHRIGCRPQAIPLGAGGDERSLDLVPESARRCRGRPSADARDRCCAGTRPSCSAEAEAVRSVEPAWPSASRSPKGCRRELAHSAPRSGPAGSRRSGTGRRGSRTCCCAPRTERLVMGLVREPLRRSRRRNCARGALPTIVTCSATGPGLPAMEGGAGWGEAGATAAGEEL